MDDPRLIPRLTPHGRRARASDEGPELEPALAERLTGWIQVGSKLGRGSTFSFSIKLGHAPQPERRGQVWKSMYPARTRLTTCSIGAGKRPSR